MRGQPRKDPLEVLLPNAFLKIFYSSNRGDQILTEAEKYMSRALELARRGEGYVSPNPMVGCVIVKDGRVISEGWHEKYGEFHAERNALLRCREDPSGADLYVTLEPCCHFGKTPPCTDIIIEKKIGRVFVGSLDVNPLVAGKGVRILREHGIEVVTGILEEECRKLNEVFYHYMSTKIPFVVMKYAMSLDGKIACATGDSKWVTGEKAREQVHNMRKKYSGILVGITTVETDDPMLNCRTEKGVDPLRIVCDSRLRISPESKIVQTAKAIPTVIACVHSTMENERMQEKIEALQNAGIELIPTDGTHGVNLPELMKILGERGIDSVLIEGGGTINSSALDEKIVDKVYAYIAPKIIGGADAPSPVRGIGAETMAEAVHLKNVSIERVDEDFCIVGYPDWTEPSEQNA